MALSINKVPTTRPTIDFDKKVDVYRNLNKPGCKFSVRQNGIVLAYVDRIMLADARFKHATVSQLSRVRSSAREVCQWITGTICDDGSWILNWEHGHEWCKLTCDPKKADGFVFADTGERIDTAQYVSISEYGVSARIKHGKS